MKNLWNQDQASKYNNDVLSLRVYTSRLLGQEENLVLHGGGNTSVKTEITNLFGEQEQVLYVKGSGWDLATIEKAGFAPVKLNVLQHISMLIILMLMLLLLLPILQMVTQNLDWSKLDGMILMNHGAFT